MDVFPVRDAAEGAVVEVQRRRAVFVDEVVERIQDPQRQFILLNEGQYLFDGYGVIVGLLHFAQDL